MAEQQILPLREMLRLHGRMLTFRASGADYEAMQGWRFLLMGLLWTWLVGMGRWWDHPDTDLLQRLGVGSLVYTLFLSGFLWIFFRAYKTDIRRYLRIWTFITLTSPPAAIYAIPVEMWLSEARAYQVNVGFLLLVAAWRVGLLVNFIRVGGGLRGMKAVIASLFPLTTIVAPLSLFTGLLIGIATGMGGMQSNSGEEAMASALMVLGLVSCVAWLPMAFLWFGDLSAYSAELNGQKEGYRVRNSGEPLPPYLEQDEYEASEDDEDEEVVYEDEYVYEEDDEGDDGDDDDDGDEEGKN